MCWFIGLNGESRCTGQQWHANGSPMKVGDLVKIVNIQDLGIIIEKQSDALDGLGMYWRVLFPDGDKAYIREADLRVVSENR